MCEDDEKTLLMLNLLKIAMLKEELYTKVSAPIDPKYLNKDKSFDELLAEGKSFKEINQIMKARKTL